MSIINNTISNHPVLSSEEERKHLLGYYETKSKYHQDKLVTHNLRLILSIMKRYKFNPKEKDDIFQEGTIGLIKSVEKYDPHRGVPFVSYASYWITAYIIRYLMDKVAMVKTCTTQNKRKLYFSLAKERARLNSQSEKEVSNAELAEHLGVSESDVVEVFTQNTQCKDLDDNMESKELFEEELEGASCCEKFNEICEQFKAKLNNKFKIVFERRIENPSSETFEKIGEHLNVTRQRIQQIEKKLISDFRKCLLLNNFQEQEMVLALSMR